MPREIFNKTFNFISATPASSCHDTDYHPIKTNHPTPMSLKPFHKKVVFTLISSARVISIIALAREEEKISENCHVQAKFSALTLIDYLDAPKTFFQPISPSNYAVIFS